MYGKFIQYTRELFGHAPRTFSAEETSELNASEPEWLINDSRQAIHDLYFAAPWVFARGDVRWGAIVLSYPICWQENSIDASAGLVHSPDRYFDDNPNELLAIGKGLFGQKSKDTRYPELRKFADAMRDGEDVHIHELAPIAFTSGRTIEFTTAFVVRRHLPLPYLAVALVPLVVLTKTGQCWILPSRWWSPAFIAKWIDSIPVVPKRIPFEGFTL